MQSDVGNLADGQQAMAGPATPHQILVTVDIGHGSSPPLISTNAEIKEPPAPRPELCSSERFEGRSCENYPARSLVALGYSLTVDGVIGPVTMGAIEDALANVKTESAQRPPDGLGRANLTRQPNARMTDILMAEVLQQNAGVAQSQLVVDALDSVFRRSGQQYGWKLTATPGRCVALPSRRVTRPINERAILLTL